MATEQTGEKPTAAQTGEALASATPEGGTTSSDSPTGAGETTKKAGKPKREAKPRATAAKGTTGSALAKADGSQTTAAKEQAADSDSDAATATAGLRTVTGSDETTSSKVYSGEPPMSQEDTAKAAKGRDPLKTVVPDGAAYGSMGIMHMAKNTEAPIGPTGNVPTGSAHTAVKEADKLAAPLTEAMAEAEKASE